MKKILFLLLTGIWFSVQAQKPQFPASSGQAIADFAGLLTEPQQEQLSRKLFYFRDKTSQSLTVVTVPLQWLGELTVEEYTAELTELWWKSQRANNRGILLLIAGSAGNPAGNLVRLEAGRGVEKKLPGGAGYQIQLEKVMPHLRKGEVFEAIDSGVTALFEVTTGESSGRLPGKEYAFFRNKRLKNAFLILLSGVIAATAGLYWVYRGGLIQLKKAFSLSVLSGSTSISHPLPLTPSAGTHDPQGWGVNLEKINKQDYAGTWEGIGVRIEISMQGKGQVEIITGTKKQRQSGFTKFTDHATLTFGNSITELTLKVTQPPFQHGNTWRMIVDQTWVQKIIQPNRKLIELGYAEYCGYWQASDATFELSAAGLGLFSAEGWEHKGEVYLTKGGFYVDSIYGPELITVNQPPHRENGQWYLQLNGLVFLKTREETQPIPNPLLKG